MKAMSATEAKAYYTPVIEGEIRRCDMFIAELKKAIADFGENETILALLKEYEDERAIWAAEV